MKTFAVILTSIAACLGLAASASAHSYVPKDHHACKAHYRRTHVKLHREHRRGRLVRRHGKVVWVWQTRCVSITSKPVPVPRNPTPTPTPVPIPTPPVSAPAPTVSYSTQVDPSFTQASGDPLSVTYAYSADATASTAATASAPARMVDLAAAAQLPAGILDFYSPTAPGGPAGLVCSINVGGAVSAGSCPVAYGAAGTYSVTTEYIPSGVTAVTQTSSETISPYSTTTTEQVSTVPFGNGTGYDITGTPSVIDQNGNALPAGSATNTATLTQLSGQVTMLDCVGGQSLILPQVGASLSCSGVIQVEISAPSTATLSVTGVYGGGPGYSGSVSAAVLTTF